MSFARCPDCRGCLAFSFMESAKFVPVYRCTRCPTDERLFIVTPDAITEVKAFSKHHKGGADWYVEPVIPTDRPKSARSVGSLARIAS